THGRADAVGDAFRLSGRQDDPVDRAGGQIGADAVIPSAALGGEVQGANLHTVTVTPSDVDDNPSYLPGIRLDLDDTGATACYGEERLGSARLAARLRSTGGAADIDEGRHHDEEKDVAGDCGPGRRHRPFRQWRPPDLSRPGPSGSRHGV